MKRSDLAPLEASSFYVVKAEVAHITYSQILSLLVTFKLSFNRTVKHHMQYVS